MLLEILKKYIEAKKAAREEYIARKELLKDKLRETYFRQLVDKVKDEEGKYLKVTISMNDGHDWITIEPSERNPNGKKTFWDKYNDAQAARGTLA